MKHLSVLIKPASSACNLKCQYCFYVDVSNLREVRSFGMMNEQVMRTMIDNIYLDLKAGDHITFAFQGGEPTLVGLDFFKKFVKYVQTQSKKVHIHYAIQTNGILIDDEWCEFFKEHAFLVGLSIDGNAQLHDENRLNSQGKGTFKKVMEAKRRFDQYDIDYNVLCVLTNKLARHPEQVFKFLIKEKICFIQFIPCLDDLHGGNSLPYALKPERFAYFYKQLFILWKREFDKGNYISITLFDNIVHLLKTGRVATCGMLGKCMPHYVIEANGNSYPCDFYVLDEYCVGNITESKLSEIFCHPSMQKFLVCDQSEIAEICKECSYYQLCRGGCKRMRNVMYLNESESYCGYQDFLKAHFNNLHSLR